MQYIQPPPRPRHRPLSTRKAIRRARTRRRICVIFMLMLVGFLILGMNRLFATYDEAQRDTILALRPLQGPASETVVYASLDAETEGEQLEYQDEEISPVEELSANWRLIERTMGLFENMYDTHMKGYLRAQYVYILEENGDWLQIKTEYGPLWIYLNFVPPTYALDQLLARHGSNLSVFYENLHNRFIYRYNADRVYFSASVPKALYALYLYKLAEDGLLDLDSMHEFTYADANWGSGIIQRRYEFGAMFSLRELLRLNISESDNVATLMLRRIHGLDGYKELISSIGGNPDLVGSRVMNSNLTANEAGLFARAIFEYVESGGRYSHEMRAHLLNNQFPFITSDYPVASKTGWTSPRAWHDMAIIYAPSPFTLVILSAREGWTDADYADFAEISTAFQEFNNKWFGSLFLGTAISIHGD